MHSYSHHFLTIFRSFWEHRFLIWQMTRREVVGRYQGSAIGLLWSFFNPLLMLGVYTFVFSVIFPTRWPAGPGGKSQFAILLFAGLIVHTLFAECASRAPGLILRNVNYVKKVVFPLEVLAWVSLGSALFHTTASVLMLLLFYAVTHSSLHWTVVFLPLIFLPFALLIAGMSWFLAAVGVFVRDVGHTIGLVTTVMLFLSPVFYPRDSLSAHYQQLIMLNPLTFIIEQVRGAIIFGTAPDWRGLAVYTVCSVLIAWCGLIWFQRSRNSFADVI